MDGWLKLHRSLSDHWIFSFKEPDKALAWIDLLIMARHTGGTVMMKGRALQLERGQVGVSQLALQKKWGWSQNKVKRFLVLLKKHAMIDYETNDLTTVVTICNFEAFQGGERPSERPNGRADERPVGRTANDQSDEDIRKKEREERENAKNIDKHFEFFWLSGMRKIGKKASLTAFKAAAKKHGDIEQFTSMLINDVRQRVASNQFGFDKLHPERYLKNERWTDEVTTNEASQSSSQQRPLSTVERIAAANGLSPTTLQPVQRGDSKALDFDGEFIR